MQWLFAVSPRNPIWIDDQVERPNDPYASAQIWTYGGVTRPQSYLSLTSQYDKDELYLGQNTAPIGDEDLTFDSFHSHAGLLLQFTANNVNEDNTYVIIAGLSYVEIGQSGIYPNPQIQFGIGNQILQTELASNFHTQYHVLEIPCPGDGQWIGLKIRLVSNDYHDLLRFIGIGGFVI